MTNTGNRGQLCFIVLYFACAISAAAQPSPQASATLLEQGHALAAAGRLAEAEVPLTAAAALAPDDIQILTMLAKVKGRLGESKDAIALFRRVATAQPRSATAHLNLAIALADTVDIQAALSEVNQAILLDPRSARAHLNRARLLADAGHASAAETEFHRAARLNSQDPEIAYFWGVFEKANHRPKAAAPLFAEVVAKQPENGQAYLLLGQSLEELGRPQDAVDALRRAIALDPSSQEAVYALSQSLRKTDPAAAARMLDRFTQLRSESQQTERARELGNKAYTAMQQQSWLTAIDALQQAITICGQCTLEAALHQRLGLAECRNGQLDIGEKELRIALTLKPDDRQAVEALQWIADQRRLHDTTQ